MDAYRRDSRASRRIEWAASGAPRCRWAKTAIRTVETEGFWASFPSKKSIRWWLNAPRWSLSSNRQAIICEEKRSWRQEEERKK